MVTLLLPKIKTALRIKHTALDEDIKLDIEACLADLKVCGVEHAQFMDPLVINAVKLYCRAAFTDDTVKGAEYLRRYESLKACLMMAEGYGWEADEDD